MKTDSILESFKKFLADPEAYEFFITGQAGTGKTTYLNNLYCYALEQNKRAIACAHTHKACNVLRTKLIDKAIVCTTHSYLKKRPSVNEHATIVDHLNMSLKQGESEAVDVVFIDEYGMLGERDYADIGLIQDPLGDGTPIVKMVYLGDPNQLPPVNDQQAIRPSGKYKHVLTKIWRQAGDSTLLDIMCKLVTYIEGAAAAAEPLLETAHFKRKVDLIATYKQLAGNAAVLAYTNQRVEELNQQLAGKVDPLVGDAVYSPTNRQHYTVHNDHILPMEVSHIYKAFGEPLMLGSKYKSLEHLLKMDCCEFMEVTTEDNEQEIYAVVFGHYQYKIALEQYANTAVSANAAIEAKFSSKAKEWAQQNNTHPLAKARSTAWRDYITFKENVVCMDFPYAMTIHKSQGSTFDNVLIDMQDLDVCASRDYTMYLRLLYVAISRAKNCVYTN